MTFPKLIVFDLDFTLWDCGGTWCDCLAPPFRRRDGRVLDRDDRLVRLYPEIQSILDFCCARQLDVGLASRTEQPEWARRLLDLLELTDHFAFTEIYPASKLKHFSALRTATGLEYDSMLFFDDEMRNIDEVSRLGVTSVFVANGMSMDLLQDGLKQFVANLDESRS